VETLADLMVVGRRLREVDPEGQVFPKLIDAFYDLVGYTVEAFIEGRNCLTMAANFPGFFTDIRHLHHLARGCLRGLSLLDLAGIVHNDMKPDNLMWVTAESRPLVKIVDFGCARLDMREEPGRNWSLAEGGLDTWGSGLLKWR
jgi:serine/threonine protein kinase